jgi:hypothetical protein
VINPLGIATGGFLPRSPLSLATDGYLQIPSANTPIQARPQGIAVRPYVRRRTEERPAIKSDDDEIAEIMTLTLAQVFIL